MRVHVLEYKSLEELPPIRWVKVTPETLVLLKDGLSRQGLCIVEEGKPTIRKLPGKVSEADVTATLQDVVTELNHRCAGVFLDTRGKDGGDLSGEYGWYIVPVVKLPARSLKVTYTVTITIHDVPANLQSALYDAVEGLGPEAEVSDIMEEHVSGLLHDFAIKREVENELGYGMDIKQEKDWT